MLNKRICHCSFITKTQSQSQAKLHNLVKSMFKLDLNCTSVASTLSKLWAHEKRAHEKSFHDEFVLDHGCIM